MFTLFAVVPLICWNHLASVLVFFLILLELLCLAISVLSAVDLRLSSILILTHIYGANRISFSPVNSSRRRAENGLRFGVCKLVIPNFSKKKKTAPSKV